MSLRNNLELIIEYPQPQGNYRCRGFHNLRLPVPVYVAFDGGSPGDQGVACDLGERLCEEVLRFLGATEEDSMPCQGSRAGLDCHALSENTCLKLHVRPAASSGAGPTAHFPLPLRGSNLEWPHAGSNLARHPHPARQLHGTPSHSTRLDCDKRRVLQS